MFNISSITGNITLSFYATTDLPELKTEEAGITIQIFGSWTGTLLSLQSTEFEYILGDLDGRSDVKVCKC